MAYLILSFGLICIGFGGVIINRTRVSRLQSTAYIIFGICVACFGFAERYRQQLSILLLMITVLLIFTAIYTVAIIALSVRSNNKKMPPPVEIS